MNAFPWKANHAEEQPLRIVVYDTESYQNDLPKEPGRVAHTFRLGCAQFYKRTGDNWREKGRESFSDQGRMLDWILSHCRKREPVWVYAHNAAFDATLLGVWDALDNHTLRLSEGGHEYTDPRSGKARLSRDWRGAMAVDNLPFILETMTDNGKIKWVDTLNYIPVSLADLGEWVKLPKWGLPGDEATDEDWYRYCMNDVDVLAAAVFKLMNLWRGRRLGNWQTTVAGLAFSSFRHVCPHSGIIAHGDEPATPEELADFWIARKPFPLDAYDVSRLERRAYYGPRTLVNFVGDIGPISMFQGRESLFDPAKNRPRIDGPVTVYDVNGLYAHAMAENVFPVALTATYIKPDINVLTDRVFHCPCIADVLLSSPDVAYPVTENKRTVYVRGRFQTSLCGPELRQAVEGGHVIACHTLAVYKPGQPFRDFVRYWWDMRTAAKAAGDKCTAKLCKQLINSLYGKLGQRTPIWERVEDVIPERQWGAFIFDRGDGSGFQRFRSVAGYVQELKGRRDCLHTFVPAAAFVTAYGRVYMERLVRYLPSQSVLYSDTDSLFCLPPAVEALSQLDMLSETALGKLKCEGTYESMSIYGAKNYDKAGEPTIAGLRKKREDKGHRRWLQWHFERCNSIIGRKPDGSVHAWQKLFAAPGSTPGYSVHGNGWTVATRRG